MKSDWLSLLKKGKQLLVHSRNINNVGRIRAVHNALVKRKRAKWKYKECGPNEWKAINNAYKTWLHAYKNLTPSHSTQRHLSSTHTTIWHACLCWTHCRLQLCLHYREEKVNTLEERILLRILLWSNPIEQTLDVYCIRNRNREARLLRLSGVTWGLNFF